MAGNRCQRSDFVLLLGMYLFPAGMGKFESKMKALERSQHFSLCRSMGIFSDAPGQLTPQSMIYFRRNFKLIRDFMVVLVTCKNEEDPIKNDRARVLTVLSISWPNFELV